MQYSILSSEFMSISVYLTNKAAFHCVSPVVRTNGRCLSLAYKWQVSISWKFCIESDSFLHASVLYCNWQASVLYCNWQASVLYCNWQASVLYCNLQASVLYCIWQASVLYCIWQASVCPVLQLTGLCPSPLHCNWRDISPVQYSARDLPNYVEFRIALRLNQH